VARLGPGKNLLSPRVHLDRETMAPTTRGYTDFLLRTATIGDFAKLVAALLPCMWGFNEIGHRLAANGQPDDQHYARGIETYASDEFTALADWLHELTNRIGADLANAPRERMREAFVTSSRYELSFWEVGWTLGGLAGTQWMRSPAIVRSGRDQATG
jgi:thiaminase/transcriptional activator TenA